MIQNWAQSGLLLAGNALLSDLDRSDLHLLIPHFSRQTARHGEILFDVGSLIDRIYFPETAVISIVTCDGLHDRVEHGVIGREGYVGWSALMGCEVAPCRAVVQHDGGTLLAIDLKVLAAAARASSTLLTTLLKFAGVMAVQTMSSLVAHGYPLASRLSRWLLMRHDRISNDTILVLHEEIRISLGVRRASVTDSLHILEGERLIRSRRGQVQIVDRTGLEERAGQCYGAAESYHRQMLSKSSAAHSEVQIQPSTSIKRFDPSGHELRVGER